MCNSETGDLRILQYGVRSVVTCKTLGINVLVSFVITSCDIEMRFTAGVFGYSSYVNWSIFIIIQEKKRTVKNFVNLH